MPISTSVVVSAIVRNQHAEFLLIPHPVRGWEPPGGRIEPGEDLAASLVREVWEETGLNIRIGALMGVYQNIGDISRLIFVFAGEVASGDMETGGESLAVGWFSAAQALTAISHPGTLHRFQELLMFKPGQISYHSFTRSQNNASSEYLVHTQRIL